MTVIRQFDIENIGLGDNELGIIFSLLQNTDQVFIVGGAVRDLLLGKTPKDFDVATDLRPNDVICLFGNKKAKLTGNTFPTVRVKNGEAEIEVSTFRAEVGSSLNGDKTDCVVEFADNIHDDLARRDLVVNAIAINVLTGEVVDPFGGFEDIQNRTIRFVEDPHRRIAEDPTRLIRALRFRLKLDGTFDPTTKEALADESSKRLFLDNVPAEQIRAEILKGLATADGFSQFFTDLHDIGLLGDLFPEVENLINLDGGPHHNEDVFTHSLLVGDAFKIDDVDDVKDVLGKLAAFLHDVGKFVSFDPEKRSFIGHNETSAELIDQILTRFRFSNDEVAFVKKLVLNHMRVPNTLKGVRKLFAEFGDDIKFLLKLFRADILGNTKKDDEAREQAFARVLEIERLLEEVRAEQDSFLKLAVSGFDVINELGLKQGKIIGEVLGFLKEAVFENPELNDRETLLQLARQEFTS